MSESATPASEPKQDDAAGPDPSRHRPPPRELAVRARPPGVVATVWRRRITEVAVRLPELAQRPSARAAATVAATVGAGVTLRALERGLRGLLAPRPDPAQRLTVTIQLQHVHVIHHLVRPVGEVLLPMSVAVLRQPGAEGPARE